MGAGRRHAADVQAVTRQHRHLRVLLREGDRTVGVVHVRDTLAEPDLGRPARDIAREPVLLPHDTFRPRRSSASGRPARLAIVTRGEAELGRC